MPLIIVLHELMFFSDSRFTIHDSRFKKRVLFLIPFLLTMLIIPLSFIGPELNIYKPEISIGEEIRQGQLKEATILSRHAYSLTQFRILVTYIRLLFFPINLNINYDYPIFSSFLNPEVFLAFMFLLIFFAFGIYLFYASRVTHCALRLVAFGIFWFFVTLSVESSVIPIKDVIFEHRLYLPSVGLIIAFSTGLFLTLQRVISTTVRQNDRTTEWGSSFSFPPIDLPLYCAVALIIFLSITTYQRNVIWQDRVSLWKDVVYKSPNNAKGHNNLGVAIYLAKGLLDEAIKHYQIALKIKPDYPEAHYNLGNVYRNKGWLDKAIEHYQIAIRLKPDYPETHNNLGIAYSQKNRTDKAIEHYQIAIRLRPDYPEAYYNLGILYKNNGMLDEAITCLQIAIRLKPDYSEAYYYLGEAYYAKGWNDKAMEYYNIARRLKADQK
ncbi:MAG: tetratricopeptide repeat protein [Nitrospirae bacterium]|nr:tetratricopeptide repeat protein [Nitrospirota bacterium]